MTVNKSSENKPYLNNGVFFFFFSFLLKVSLVNQSTMTLASLTCSLFCRGKLEKTNYNFGLFQKVINSVTSLRSNIALFCYLSELYLIDRFHANSNHLKQILTTLRKVSVNHLQLERCRMFQVIHAIAWYIFWKINKLNIFLKINIKITMRIPQLSPLEINLSEAKSVCPIFIKKDLAKKVTFNIWQVSVLRYGNFQSRA